MSGPLRTDEYLEAFSEESQAYHIAEAAAHIAAGIGFDGTACSEIKMAVSEIAINAVRYAGGGTATIRCLNGDRILELLIHDRGSGIGDLERAQEEGFSTFPGSLGLGLSVARRSMDELLIRSSESGTEVILRKFLPIPVENAEYGIVSIPDVHYDINGDSFCIREFDGNKVLLAVIDGLGQGPEAAAVAGVARDIILAEYRLPLNELIAGCDRAIRRKFDNSGIALALVLVQGREICFASVGDIHVKVFTPEEDHYLVSQPGIVGNFALPGIRISNFAVRDKVVIILCSDGIHDHFGITDLDITAHAQDTAEFIMKNYHRSYGDATVLVAKISGL